MPSSCCHESGLNPKQFESIVLAPAEVAFVRVIDPYAAWAEMQSLRLIAG